MKKGILVFILVLLAVCLLVSCDGAAVESTAPETTVPETTEPPCPHTEQKRTLMRAATCSTEGLELYVCEACGAQEEKEIPVRHFWEETYERLTEQTLSECVFCGIRGYLVEAGESLVLSANLGGSLRFAVQAAFGEGEVDFWVDDELCDTVTAWDEPALLEAEGLSEAAHVFCFNNVGDNDVLIDASQLVGRLCAVIVERLPAAGQTYSSVNLYVQTSDPSGDYYVRYCLQYEYSDVRNDYTTNSCTNRASYRIKTAQLVEVIGFDEEAVEYNKLFDVLGSGEISLAANQLNPVWSKLTDGARSVLGNRASAPDQVGGYHGDERMERAVLLVDGEELELFGQSEGAVLPCTSAGFDQISTIYAWGTSTADSYGWPILRHSQSFTFDKDGVRNRKSLQWLDDGYETGSMFFHMLTMYRQSGGKAICEIVETFDDRGNSLGRRVVPLISDDPSRTSLSNPRATRVHYSSATSGVSATTGYRILNGSVVCNRLYIMERVSDNKLYVSFASAKNGAYPRKGELWEVEVDYHIDYVAP